MAPKPTDLGYAFQFVAGMVPRFSVHFFLNGSLNLLISMEFKTSIVIFVHEFLIEKCCPHTDMSWSSGSSVEREMASAQHPGER